MGGKIPSDAQIVELYFARDEAAIGQTDRKYGKYLFTVAYNILADERDCEEVLNDTYLAAWNSIPPHRPATLAAFLAKIARRTAISRYRDKMRVKRIPSELTESLEEMDEFLPASDDADSDVISRVLNEFLRAQSERDRNIFVCRYCFSDSIKKIAQMTGMSESSIFKKLAAMREGLKEALGKESISL